MKRSDWVRDLLQKSCLMPWCLHDDLSYQTPPTQPITALHSWLTATGLNRRMGETILQARGGYHSLAGLFIPTPAVWEPLTFPLTFLQRSWLPPCCSWVTQTLINACDIWRGISDWAEGLGFIWLLGLIQQALLILCTLRKAAVVKVFWSNCVSRFRASVTSAACYVRVCLGRCHLNSWALTVHSKPLMAFTNTVHLLRVELGCRWVWVSQPLSDLQVCFQNE